MKKKAIFLIDRQSWGSNVFHNIYTPNIFESLHSLVDLCEGFTDRENMKENAEMLKNADVAFSTWGMPDFSEEEVRKFMPNLKAVFYAAGSVQGFAPSFLNNGIILVSSWAANAVPVAEYTVAQILLANKGFYQAALKTKGSYKDARSHSEAFPGNYSVKVGIIGAGMIGSKVIESLKPYNIDILVFDPFLSEEKAKTMGVTKCSLIDVFSKCQTISNHLANLPATVGILNSEHFDRMLSNATFINTGRGAQVVESDLINALKAGPSRTAVLDVTDPEPVESGSELLKLDNVFLTPHIAGSMSNELERMAWYALDEFVRFEKGEELKYSVTLKMLETMA